MNGKVERLHEMICLITKVHITDSGHISVHLPLMVTGAVSGSGHMTRDDMNDVKLFL